MPARPRTCVVITCDVCDTPLADEDDTAVHWDAEEHAVGCARSLRWPVVTGGCWICPLDDTAHRAAIDALLPPAPEPVPDGQLALALAAYPGRRRSKGGRTVHATRLVEIYGAGRQVGACGDRADAALAESPSSPVTCRRCVAVLGVEVKG